MAIEKVLDGIQEVRIIGRASKTILAMNAINIAGNGWAGSAWYDASGFDKLAGTLMNDAVLNSRLDVQWSHDGVNLHGEDKAVLNTSTERYRPFEIPVKAKYFNFRVNNQDAGAAHVFSVWAYLKA